jgi:RNA polymerase sigma-70 factor (ECF subfamily)
VSPAPTPDAEAELRRAWALLDELLARLPGELSRVLALAEVEELKVSDIAALEGIPVGTAASRLRRAREEFGRLLRASRHKNPFSKDGA